MKRLIRIILVAGLTAQLRAQDSELRDISAPSTCNRSQRSGLHQTLNLEENGAESCSLSSELPLQALALPPDPPRVIKGEAEAARNSKGKRTEDKSIFSFSLRAHADDVSAVVPTKIRNLALAVLSPDESQRSKAEEELASFGYRIIRVISGARNPFILGMSEGANLIHLAEEMGFAESAVRTVDDIRFIAEEMTKNILEHSRSSGVLLVKTFQIDGPQHQRGVKIVAFDEGVGIEPQKIVKALRSGGSSKSSELKIKGLGIPAIRYYATRLGLGDFLFEAGGQRAHPIHLVADPSAQIKGVLVSVVLLTRPIMARMDMASIAHGITMVHIAHLASQQSLWGHGVGHRTNAFPLMIQKGEEQIFSTLRDIILTKIIRPAGGVRNLARIVGGVLLVLSVYCLISPPFEQAWFSAILTIVSVVAMEIWFSKYFGPFTRKVTFFSDFLHTNRYGPAWVLMRKPNLLQKLKYYWRGIPEADHLAYLIPDDRRVWLQNELESAIGDTAVLHRIIQKIVTYTEFDKHHGDVGAILRGRVA